MQVYTGDFFKDASPDSEPLDDHYCGFGTSDMLEEPTAFSVPVNSHPGHGAHSDFWEITPVVYVTVFIGEVSDRK